MSLSLGTLDVAAIAVGGTEVQTISLGTDVVWSDASPPSETYDFALNDHGSRSNNPPPGTISFGSDSSTQTAAWLPRFGFLDADGKNFSDLVSYLEAQANPSGITGRFTPAGGQPIELTNLRAGGLITSFLFDPITYSHSPQGTRLDFEVDLDPAIIPPIPTPFTLSNGQHIWLDVSDGKWDAFADDLTFEVDIENWSSPNAFGRLFSTRSSNTDCYLDVFQESAAGSWFSRWAGNSSGGSTSSHDPLGRNLVTMEFDVTTGDLLVDGQSEFSAALTGALTTQKPSGYGQFRIGQWDDDSATPSGRDLTATFHKVEVKRTSSGQVLHSFDGNNFASPTFLDDQGTTWNVAT